ncbi:MAG: DUF4062 domain-containing protein [Verrucomicrobiales bacterium]|nr:DUF4062 domain-containing protein [Verrucomicrobiales bacterium]
MPRVTPHVFISAASGDLRSAREIVKNGLLTIGCHPVVQEHFEPDYRTVRDMLKTKVSECHAVIHLVGKHYGGEPNPDSLPPGTMRRSWTQMEHDVARELGVKMYLFVFDDTYPFDGSDPEPEDEAVLQQGHRQTILTGEFIYNKVRSPEALSRQIVEMRLEAAQLADELARSQTQLVDTVQIVEQSADELKEGQQQILTSVDEMRNAFSWFAEKGGIIPDPSSPEQFYFNAKLSEIKGDYGNARKYYIAYFQYDVECIDPHLRFIDFLKVQEGREGAAETYREIVKNSGSIVHELAEALIGDRKQRVAQLEAFAVRHGRCGPAYYLLSREYSAVKLGTRTLEDKRREKHYIECFQQLDGEGNVVRWFVDQSLVSEWREDAVERYTALQGTFAALENPVQVPWLSHNRGWVGTIQIAEIATKIFWRPPGGSKFISTGFLATRCYSTGQPQPQQIIELPKVTEPTSIEVTYVNLNDETMGPYTAVLEPFAESHAESKQILSISKRSWVSLREYNGKLLLYFTHLLTHRGALKQIAYGIDSNPRFRVGFPEWNQPGLAPISEGLATFVTIPNETRVVTVQVMFKDGETSEIVRVDR